MIIKISTKCNASGNRYQLLIDTEKKTYKKGSYLFMTPDIHTTKTDIRNFINYNLTDYKEEV